MSPLSFEKDDDENGHIDFITAASVSNHVDLCDTFTVKCGMWQNLTNINDTKCVSGPQRNFLIPKF